VTLAVGNSTIKSSNVTTPQQNMVKESNWTETGRQEPLQEVGKLKQDGGKITSRDFHPQTTAAKIVPKL
jgi:hypothetical protein